MARAPKYAAFVLILTVVWLVGCADKTPIPSPTTPVEALPSDVPPTPLAETATSVAESAATPTSASATAELPTPAPAATWTPEPPATPGPSPTPDPDSLLVQNYLPRLATVLPSPDGLKRVEVLIYDCVSLSGVAGEERSLEMLRVVEPARAIEYQLDTQSIFCGGLGAFGLEPLSWSASSRYLYYTREREGQPDGGCGPWVPGIVRADLSALSVTPLNQAAFSPDGALLSGWLERELVVTAVDGEELGRVAAGPLPSVGPPVWSPDGRAIAFVQAEVLCGNGASAAYLLDLASMQLRMIAESAAPDYVGATWLDAGRIQLNGWDGRSWVYDVAGGQLAPAP